MAEKPKVAFYWCASCGGCEEAIVDLAEQILAADMVGFSRLMELDEAGTVARQKSHRDELIDPQIQTHFGRIVKTGKHLTLPNGHALFDENFRNPTGDLRRHGRLQTGGDVARCV